MPPARDWRPSILAGVVLFPILLPWLPTADLSMEGFILGGIVALPFALTVFWRRSGWATWQQAASALSWLLILPLIAALLTLDFTGSTTFTPRGGRRCSIFADVPVMAWRFGGGVEASA